MSRKKSGFIASVIFYLGFALFVWSLASIISALAQTHWDFSKIMDILLHFQW